MKRKILLSLIILILLVNGLSFAQVSLPEPSSSFYVYDEANIIDREAEEYIIKTNEELYKKTGSQIVVATVNSLEGMDIREYALRLFEKWEIGSKEYDNGLLMLIVPEKREIWIEVGYGLEGPLPDSKVGNIIENSIIPYFKENNYSDGIISGFNEIIEEVEEEYNIQLERNNIDENMYSIGEQYYGESKFEGIKGILIAIGVIIFVIIDFKYFHGYLTYSLLLRGRRYGGDGNNNRSNRGGGGRSGGGGAGGRW